MGCGTCVAVCLAGGEKEMGSYQLKLALGLEDKHLEIGEITVERHAHLEINTAPGLITADDEAIVSMACGAGVQFLSSCAPCILTLP